MFAVSTEHPALPGRRADLIHFPLVFENVKDGSTKGWDFAGHHHNHGEWTKQSTCTSSVGNG